MKEKIELKNLPDKIWIQVGEIDIDFDNDFKKLRESNEVTWCEHKIDNWDIEYTRSSLIEPLINQEVERRFAEVLPTKNEIGNACQLFDKQKRPLWKEAIWRAGANWAVDLIHSRLTCSEKPNNSQKTEGGEG